MDFIFDCLAIGYLMDAETHPPVDAILNLSQFHYYTPLNYQRIYFPDLHG